MADIPQPAAASAATTPAAAADPTMESLPAGLSVWEAATQGRRVILDGDSAHDTLAEARREQERRRDALAALQPKPGKQAKAGTPAPYSPQTMEVVSREQPEYVDREALGFLKKELLDKLQTRFDKGVPVGSPLPHLTPEQGARAAHVTSSRVVGQSDDGYTIHERFHQDEGPRNAKEPKHDRFFATDADGRVYNVEAEFRDPKTPEKYKLFKLTAELQRSDADRPLLNSQVHELVRWTVDGRSASETDPPLSPRSRARRLPDTGYSLPAKHAGNGKGPGRK